MAKFIDIMIKNLKVIYRDKKGMALTFIIPIMFYALMGFIFGGSSFATVSNNSLGYINLDAQTTTIPDSEYKSLEFLLKTIEQAETDGESLFKFTNYTILNNGGVDFDESFLIAEQAMIQEDVDAVVVFERDFQLHLNWAAEIKIGFFDNDSTVYSGGNPNNWSYQVTNLYTLLLQSGYNFVWLTEIDFQTAFATTDTHDYDFFLVVNEGFEVNVESNPVNVSFYHRIGSDTVQAAAIQATLKGILDGAIYGNPTLSQLTFDFVSIEGSVALPLPTYTFYFLDSTGDIERQIIVSTFDGLFSGIVNYNPTQINFNSETKSTTGRVISTLTYNSPGYLVYGALNSMSFACISLANENQGGLLKRLKSTRMKDRDMVMGVNIANTIVVFIQFAVALVVLSLFGFTPNYLDFGTLIFGTIINVLAVALVINGIALILTPIFKTPEASGGGVWIVLIPLMMFSGMFFPIELMAPAVAQVASVLPTRMTVLVFQGLMLDRLPLTHPKVWGNLLGQFAFAIAFFFIGIKLYGKFTKADVPKKLKVKNGKQNIQKATNGDN